MSDLSNLIESEYPEAFKSTKSTLISICEEATELFNSHSIDIYADNFAFDEELIDAVKEDSRQVVSRHQSIANQIHTDIDDVIEFVYMAVRLSINPPPRFQYI